MRDRLTSSLTCVNPVPVHVNRLGKVCSKQHREEVQAKNGHKNKDSRVRTSYRTLPVVALETNTTLDFADASLPISASQGKQRTMLINSNTLNQSAVNCARWTQAGRWRAYSFTSHASSCAQKGHLKTVDSFCFFFVVTFFVDFLLRPCAPTNSHDK